MSLINDALKKARQAQPVNSAAAAGPALRPIDISRPRRNSNLTLPFVFGIVVVLVIAGFLFAIWYRSGSNQLVVRAISRPPTITAVIPNTPAPAVVEPAVLPPAPVVVAAELPPTPEPAPTVATTSVPSLETNSVIEAPAVTNEVALQLPQPVEPLLPAVILKLQAIFYEPRQPAAMINGRTVTVGGHVGNVRVVGIDLRTVTVVTAAGRTNVLKLEN